LSKLCGLLLNPLLYRLVRLPLLRVITQEPAEADHLPMDIPCRSHITHGRKGGLMAGLNGYLPHSYLSAVLHAGYLRPKPLARLGRDKDRQRDASQMVWHVME
jgi:hypothetical protein